MKALFNGCSYVWGDELKDPKGSRFSRLISEELGVEEYNISLCGASNPRIYRTTLDWIQLNGAPDIMVLVWSGLDRFEYVDFSEKDKHDFYYMQCSPSRLSQKEFLRKSNSLARYMTHILNDYKRSIDVINYMCLIQQLCELSGIKLLQFQFTAEHNRVKNRILSSIPKTDRESAFLDYYKSKVNYLKPYSSYGFSDDNDLLGLSMEISDVEVRRNYYGHPLEKSQVMFKDMMIKELEKHYDFRIQ